jgi:hypothetical protein
MDADSNVFIVWIYTGEEPQFGGVFASWEGARLERRALVLAEHPTFDSLPACQRRDFLMQVCDIVKHRVGA